MNRPPKNKSGTGLSTDGVALMASMDQSFASAGREVPDKGGAFERPGYQLQDYVAGFISTNAGPVPTVKTRLEKRDRLDTMRVRCGISRFKYTVAPGLYAAGNPDAASEVLVTANFKLTFDAVRRSLEGLDAWILVLDTKGINVWCAAGKGTFATNELVNRIETAGLSKVVRHRRLIVPQLGATGVSAGKVKQRSGFKVVYGPIRAEDIPAFLKNNRKADKKMRSVTFSLAERLILIPVEIRIALKPVLISMVALFILSGIGPGIFSFPGAWHRGILAVAAMAAGLLSGAVITPALLPHIPVRQFALKGIITGAAAGFVLLFFIPAGSLSPSATPALILFTVTVSSFLAMNFTGTTPFTSPSGVEKEMKRYIPVQLAGLLISAGLWLFSAF